MLILGKKWPVLSSPLSSTVNLLCPLTRCLRQSCKYFLNRTSTVLYVCFISWFINPVYFISPVSVTRYITQENISTLLWWKAFQDFQTIFFPLTTFHLISHLSNCACHLKTTLNKHCAMVTAILFALLFDEDLLQKYTKSRTLNKKKNVIF